MTQANSFVQVVVFPHPDGVAETQTIRYDKFVELLFKQMTEPMMAMHCALGVSGEAGELADAIKKEYIYNKPRDLEHITEELGDLLFYVHATLNHYSLREQDVLQRNAIKLQKRYASLTYSDAAAQARADKNPGAEQI